MRRLAALATRFRSAIERSDRRQDPVLCDFPSCACGDASRLLETYLIDNGFAEVEHVAARSKYTSNGLPSHAWTEWRGIIIDITSDQFADSPGPPVTVSADHAWHARFEEYERDRPGVDVFGGIATARLRAWYAVLRRELAQVAG